MSPHRAGLAAQDGVAAFAPSTGRPCDNVVKVAPMVNKQLLLTYTPAVDRRVAAWADIDSAAASVI
jgi:hypothetical protein